MERGTALLSPSKDEPVEAWGGVFAALIGLAASVVVGWSAAPALAVNACTDNCVQVSVGSGMGKVNDTVTLPVSFAQASTSDNQPGGPDEIAALAMTIGMPGGSGSAPLQLADCGVAASGLPNAVQPQIANFNVVVENAFCDNGKTHCLCPDNGSGITPDDFINLVVYGPNPLPTPGTGVQIPTIPDGTMMTIGLKIAGGSGTIPLHIYNQVMDSNHPQFTALLSVGDTQAVDQTCVPMAGVPPCSDANATSQVATTDGSVKVTGGCVGDCDGSGDVVVPELIKAVNIVLGTQQLAACPAADGNGDGNVTVPELIQGVNNLLLGCGHQ